MSGLDEGLRRLYQTLAGTGLPLFVGGSVASMWYGEPRSTLDIDLVVKATPADAERIVRPFAGDGFYVPPLEVVREELERGAGGTFNIIDLASGLKADVYVAGDDPLIEYGFAHAAAREVGGTTLSVAPATYIVAMKLRFHGISRQDKHLRDIRSILAVSPEAVDTAEVDAWAAKYGVSDVWSTCQQQPGEE